MDLPVPIQRKVSFCFRHSHFDHMRSNHPHPPKESSTVPHFTFAASKHWVIPC